MLPTVNFFGTQISRLILGDNPFNGHSYIADKTSGTEMMNYYSEEKIIETLFLAQRYGMNTWLPLADPYIIRIIQHFRSMGGKMNTIFQTCPWYGYELNMNQLMGCSSDSFLSSGYNNRLPLGNRTG